MKSSASDYCHARHVQADDILDTTHAWKEYASGSAQVIAGSSALVFRYPIRPHNRDDQQ
jgi:hypothetical protein